MKRRIRLAELCLLAVSAQDSCYWNGLSSCSKKARRGCAQSRSVITMACRQKCLMDSTKTIRSSFIPAIRSMMVSTSMFDPCHRRACLCHDLKQLFSTPNYTNLTTTNGIGVKRKEGVRGNGFINRFLSFALRFGAGTYAFSSFFS